MSDTQAQRRHMGGDPNMLHSDRLGLVSIPPNEAHTEFTSHFDALTTAVALLLNCTDDEFTDAQWQTIADLTAYCDDQERQS